MKVDNEELAHLKGISWQGEKVQGTFKQRSIGPGGSVITPTTVVVTDSRIIIVNRSSLGLKKEYEVIPYSKITSVRLERGIISSTVFVRIEGFDKELGMQEGKEEGEIDGLYHDDAKELIDFVNIKLESFNYNKR